MFRQIGSFERPFCSVVLAVCGIVHDILKIPCLGLLVLGARFVVRRCFYGITLFFHLKIRMMFLSHQACLGITYTNK